MIVLPPVPMIYCVALADQLSDRRSRMQKRFESQLLGHVMVTAITPDDEECTRLDYGCNEEHSLAITACLASHLRALRAFVNSGAEEAIVCEDDVRLRREFITAFLALRDRLAGLPSPADIDTISLGYLVWNWQGFNAGEIEGLRTAGHDLWGTQMYWIRRSWALLCLRQFNRPRASIVTGDVRTAELITRSGKRRVADPALAIEDLSPATLVPGTDISNHATALSRWPSEDYEA